MDTHIGGCSNYVGLWSLEPSIHSKCYHTQDVHPKCGHSQKDHTLGEVFMTIIQDVHPKRISLLTSTYLRFSLKLGYRAPLKVCARSVASA